MIESFRSRSFMVVLLSQARRKTPAGLGQASDTYQIPTSWKNHSVFASAAVFPTERLAPVLADSEDSRVPTAARRFGNSSWPALPDDHCRPL
jgi:hypothetical protein